MKLIDASRITLPGERHQAEATGGEVRRRSPTADKKFKQRQKFSSTDKRQSSTLGQAGTNRSELKLGVVVHGDRGPVYTWY